jgi:hypothetical protein
LAGLTKGAIPKGQRRVKSQIFDNLPYIPRSKKRISAPGLYVTFDPLMEGEECSIKDMVRSPGGMRMSVRRSYIDTDTGEGSLDENEEWAKVVVYIYYI